MDANRKANAINILTHYFRTAFVAADLLALPDSHFCERHQLPSERATE